MRTIIFCISLVTLTCNTLSADLLKLRDGRTVAGTFVSGTRDEVRFTPDGANEQTYSINDIENLVFGSGARGPAPQYRYRRSGENRSSDNSTYNTGNPPYNPGQPPYNPNNPGNQPSTSTYNNNSSLGNTNSRSTIPYGSVITVRTIDLIDSDSTSVGKTYRASVDQPVVVDGITLIPAGADATLQVVNVKQGGRYSGKEDVTLQLNQVAMNGRMYTIDSGNAEVASGSRGKQAAEVIGGTAAVGAIIGAIAGGGKGAAIGAASGAGAGAVFEGIRGQRVKVPSESKLTFKLNRDVYLQ